MFSSYRHLKKTNKTRAAIEEAVYYWRKYGKDHEDFANKMCSIGWAYMGHGAYKKCLCKHNIIVKYADSHWAEAKQEVAREVEQWKYSPRWFRARHLPKTYAYSNGLLIQEKVPWECGCDCAKLNALVKNRNDLFDVTQNHGHDKNGNVRFFDWVWRRTWALVESPKSISLKNWKDAE